MGCKRTKTDDSGYGVDLFVRVVELKDIAHTLDHLQVLVSLGVEVMQRLRIIWRPVRQCEVDRD